MKYYVLFGEKHRHFMHGTGFSQNCLAEIEADNEEDATVFARLLFRRRFKSLIDENSTSLASETAAARDGIVAVPQDWYNPVQPITSVEQKLEAACVDIAAIQAKLITMETTLASILSEVQSDLI